MPVGQLTVGGPYSTIVMLSQTISDALTTPPISIPYSANAS